MQRGFGGGRFAFAACTVGVFLAVLHPAVAEGPAWWLTRGVINSQLSGEDYAILTLGQLKWMATQAAEELNSFLPGGAGAEVNGLVDAWSTPQPGGSRIPIVTSATADYAPANLGQLKNVAKPFYNRLIALKILTSYPWQGTAEDYAIANIGQLKFLFSFGRDSDGDGIDDYWEVQFFPNDLNRLTGSSHDEDGDGVADLDEFAANTNPADPAPELSIIGPLGTSLQ